MQLKPTTPARHLPIPPAWMRALSIPHILQRVLKALPHHSLMVLRFSHPAWNHAVDCFLFQHLIVEAAWRGGRQIWLALSPYGSIETSRRWYHTGLVNSIHTLDLRLPWVPLWGQRAWNVTRLRWSPTFVDGRYCLSIYPTSRTRILNSRDGGFDPDITGQREGVVLAFAARPFHNVRTPFFKLPPKSLTLIVRPPSRRSKGTPQTAVPFPDIRDLIARELARSTPEASMPITLVGFEAWYGHPVTAFRPRTGSISGVFEEFPSEVHFELNVLHRLLELGVSPESAAELLGSLTFISLAKYRRQAGRQKYLWETARSLRDPHVV